MNDKLERELESTLTGLESLEQYREDLLTDSVSLESHGAKIDYLQVRKLQELEAQVGMEGLTFQSIKDVFGAMGRATVALGKGFMKFLDTVHRIIDTTHLVRLEQMRAKFKAIPEAEAKINKGRMERPKLAAQLQIGGEYPTSFTAYAKGAVDFSRRTSQAVIPELAMMARQIGQRVEAKRFMGVDAFNHEVLELCKIIAAYKLPMDRYADADYQRLYPGNRTIFSNIKPKRPRREPNFSVPGSRKVIEGLSATHIGLRKRPDAVSGKAHDNILPILTVEEALAMLNDAELLLKEAVRVADVCKTYRKDQVPSTSSMMLSGFLHGVKRQWDDVWTAQDDGFHVIEGAHQGGAVKRHDPGKRNMLGGGIAGGGPIGMLSYEEPSMEASKNPEEENERRAQLAVWVSRYLKLSLIDHQKTSQALILLLVGIARSYLDYAEESLDYYT